jgi:hypothetical protein
MACRPPRTPACFPFLVALHFPARVLRRSALPCRELTSSLELQESTRIWQGSRLRGKVRGMCGTTASTRLRGRIGGRSPKAIFRWSKIYHAPSASWENGGLIGGFRCGIMCSPGPRLPGRFVLSRRCQPRAGAAKGEDAPRLWEGTQIGGVPSGMSAGAGQCRLRLGRARADC